MRKIRSVVLGVAERYGVVVDKIILFGSRARGDYRENSDWDILIVTKDKLHLNEKIELWYDIYRGLGLPADIIIVSKEILEKFKNSKGFIYSYAISEGVVV